MSATCLTFDIDWAPEHIILELRETLQRLQIPATIFFTHDSEASRSLAALPTCEVGIHPNFLAPNLGKEPEAIIDDLLRHFPSRGMRSHALYFHTRLLPIVHRTTIRYLSNDLHFLQPSIAPSYDWSGLVRLPIFWEDDVHCAFHHQRASFSLSALPLDQAGLKVFNFHPVHLYLNTHAMSSYHAAKADLPNASRASAHKHRGLGVRTLFDDLVAAIPTTGWSCLGDVAQSFANDTPYRGNTPAYFETIREET